MKSFIVFLSAEKKVGLCVCVLVVVGELIVNKLCVTKAQLLVTSLQASPRSKQDHTFKHGLKNVFTLRFALIKHF